ncbi:MAG TPA: phasin family protein [Alphaproteobacteria bacterium]|nr:phasin family protein [Alphaproteobacteria bacterium]
MTKGAKQADSGNNIPHIDYGRLMALSSANADAFMKASEAMLKGLAQLNGELVNFTSTQLKEHVEGSQAIAQCSNWSEALEKQMSMARTVTEQYLSEASKLAGLATELTMASWAPFEAYLRTSVAEQGIHEKKL